MLVDFNLALLNLTQKSLPESYLQIQAATRIEVQKQSPRGVLFSCEFCEISKNTFSYRTPSLAASGSSDLLLLWSTLYIAFL